jgi:C1A family cysteine protease
MNKIDLRPLFLSVRDQGPRGTCVAFAVTAAHELARWGLVGSFEDLSEEALYWNCKQADSDQQEGTFFTSASDVLKHTGQPHEAKWPYDGFRNEHDGTYVPPHDAVDHQFCFKAKLISIQADVKQIKDCLKNGQAVMLGIPTYASFIIAPQGRVPMPGANESDTGGHAVLVVGYEEDALQGDWLIFRNSWGDGWGDGGYGYLPYDYIRKYGGETWIIQP